MIMEHDRETRTVKINMKKYIEDTITGITEEEPELILRHAATPATDNLFRTRECVEKISLKQAKIYHSVVAKLFFVAKRARPDILLTVSFLATRVKNPDLDDWKKLLGVLGYLQGTAEITFTLTCEKLDKLTWFIDGSYASHMDMRGQSGGVLMTGDCAVLFKSCKQKVNTRSSTEAELIAVDDMLPMIHWTRNFFKGTGIGLRSRV
jgi:hypothetical protein